MSNHYTYDRHIIHHCVRVTTDRMRWSSVAFLQVNISNCLRPVELSVIVRKCATNPIYTYYIGWFTKKLEIRCPVHLNVYNNMFHVQKFFGVYGSIKQKIVLLFWKFNFTLITTPDKRKGPLSIVMSWSDPFLLSGVDIKRTKLKGRFCHFRGISAIKILH